ncbi:helix-turn-helix transcriptional regulator [Treponema sp.]|uniref:helix-turn-helix domain-containing protein n=1 Tax=Treponema sp. TaxID=166 RepID=UPI00298E3E68|nr:helix-turn-helix transcriptional regulator [Treponema sp.]MCQ2241260.1 helix-turn-helix domain-containing protein [Treponema sp.]
MNSKEIFGTNLRHYRKLNNLTQEELSEKLDITAIHLGRIENGKSFVTAELLDSLCVIFNVSPASFFYTAQEFSGDDSLFAKIDSVIDQEIENFSKEVKQRIRNN